MLKMLFSALLAVQGQPTLADDHSDCATNHDLAQVIYSPPRVALEMALERAKARGLTPTSHAEVMVDYFADGRVVPLEIVASSGVRDIDGW